MQAVAVAEVRGQTKSMPPRVCAQCCSECVCGIQNVAAWTGAEAHSWSLQGLHHTPHSLHLVLCGWRLQGIDLDLSKHSGKSFISYSESGTERGDDKRKRKESQILVKEKNHDAFFYITCEVL